MNGRGAPRLANERLTQSVALLCLLVMGAWILFGPSGVISWSENSRLLIERQMELEQLSAESKVIQNRVALLDPNHVDPDLAGQLLRTNLNVVNPDEMVLLLD
jgi:cell division protein FtsB